jgi:hypothetical protein
MENAPKRAELNKELTTARRTLLAVGLIMFAMDMVFTHGINRDRLLPEGRMLITAISTGLLAVFLALWYFTPRRPRLCLGLALAIFWALQLVAAVNDPATIKNGIVLKVIFTVALVNGFKSANRATMLKRELETVFE